MESETENLSEQVVFIILNLVFFSIMLLFVFNSSSGAFAKEQLYAKQIGLVIESSRPGTLLTIDVTDAYNLAKKNGVDASKMFSFSNGNVSVRLSTSRVYNYPYFSDGEVVIADSGYTMSDSKVKLNLFVKQREVKNEN